MICNNADVRPQLYFDLGLPVVVKGNFGTRLRARLIEGVRLIGGPLDCEQSLFSRSNKYIKYFFVILLIILFHGS